jgi:hypothetical protein
MSIGKIKEDEELSAYRGRKEKNSIAFKQARI